MTARIVVLIVALLSLPGCFVLRMKDVKDLEAKIAQANVEMQRLEYVRKRAAELVDAAAVTRAAIEDAAARKAVAADTPPQDVTLAPEAAASLRLTPSSMTRVPSANPSVRELQDWLDEFNADIQRGINLEKKLPALERDVAALKKRLAEIEAMPGR